MIDTGGGQGRGQMLQPGGLEPTRHDRIPRVASGACIVEGPAAGVVVEGGRGRSIALLHLATHVALRSPLRSQFSRSIEQRFTRKAIHQIQNQGKKKKTYTEITLSKRNKKSILETSDLNEWYSQGGEKSNSK